VSKKNRSAKLPSEVARKSMFKKVNSDDKGFTVATPMTDFNIYMARMQKLDGFTLEGLYEAKASRCALFVKGKTSVLLDEYEIDPDEETRRVLCVSATKWDHVLDVVVALELDASPLVETTDHHA